MPADQDAPVLGRALRVPVEGPPGPPALATVVIVGDAAAQRRLLRTAIEADPDFAVVGEARNGREAVVLVDRLRPAVVLMDLDLPLMGGIEAIERIMSSTPTPIVVYAPCTGTAQEDRTAEALAAGAVDVLAARAPEDPCGLAAYTAVLHSTLRVAARVRVITHPRGRLRTQGLGASVPSPVAPLALTDGPTGEGRFGTVRLIAVGASTGGPQALLTLLRALPADLAQAVLVVQHMAEGFIPGLATWLDGLVALPVVVGGSGRRLLPGTVTIAPSGGNLLVQDDRLRVLCVPPDPGQFHVPGIDATFASVAQALGPDAIGVLLTGMGRDGAAGLLEMRDRGALTIGQDEATSTVYGMPAAAFALSAVERQLPLDQIAPALLRSLGRTAAP